MNFLPYSSGSHGNMYMLSANGEKLLIDVGLTGKQLHKVLNFKTHELVGCLISHAHMDHAKGHKELTKHGVELYMSHQTATMIGSDLQYTSYLESNKEKKIGSFIVYPFEAVHDMPGCLGFAIKHKHDQDTCLYLTDSYYSKFTFKGMTIMAVECNYSDDMLEDNMLNGKSNGMNLERVKQTHFGLNNLVEFLKACDLTKTKQIYLMHLSNRNADEKLIVETIKKETGKEIIVC
jgi:phosphoribosyl 1,2-cyclic phosphodiesterase